MNWAKIGKLVGDVAPILGGILGGPLGATVGGVVARALGTAPDPDAVAHVLASDPAAYAKIKMLELEHSSALAQMRIAAQTAQVRVNQVEAASSNLFVAGARPMILWVCAAAFCWQFVLAPIAVFVASAAGHRLGLPVLNFGELQTVLLGLLGLGGARTLEKIKGVNGRHG